MTLSNTLIDRIEEANYTIRHCYDDIYEIGKYSPAGQDFSFYIHAGENIDNFLDNIRELYSDFDVSYEAYQWLGKDGHGTNGAPYDMKEVYEDAVCCHDYIFDLFNIVNKYRIQEGGEI